MQACRPLVHPISPVGNQEKYRKQVCIIIHCDFRPLKIQTVELSALSMKLGNFRIETALLSPTNPSSRASGAISPAVEVYASSRPTSVEPIKATKKCLAVSRYPPAPTHQSLAESMVYMLRIYEGPLGMSSTPSRQNHPPQDEDFELYSRERSRPGSPMTQDIEFLGGLGGDGERSYDIDMEPPKLDDLFDLGGFESPAASQAAIDESLKDDLFDLGGSKSPAASQAAIDESLKDDLFDLGGSKSPAASQAAIDESLDDLFDLGGSESPATSRVPIDESLEDDLFDLGGSESPATSRVPIDESLEDDLFDLGGSESPAAIDESLADDLFDLGGSESPAASRAAIDESLADDLFDLGDSNGSPRPLIDDSLGDDMFDVGTSHSPPPIESLADDLFDLGSQTSSAHIDESLTDELFNLGSSQSRAASELSSEDEAGVNVP